MSDRKNQHFVPRVYLRGFAPSDNDKVVGLYNIRRGLFVDRAPLKGQCSRDFFHGHDDLETTLGEIEGGYGSWISRGVLADPPVLVEAVDHFLRFYMMLQYMRTEYAVMRMRSQYELMEKMSHVPSDDPGSSFQMTDTDFVRDSIRATPEFTRYIDDLKCVFIRNESGYPFVTCDDPVVFTNRVMIQRMRDDSFGFGGCGALFYMPMSPHMAVLLYDRDAYAPPKDSKDWLTLKKPADARAFNGLIFLKAKENIYFQTSRHFDRSHFEEVSPNRIDKWQMGTVLKKVESRAGEEVYERVDLDAAPPGESLIALSVRHPKPSAWPSVVPFRRPIVGYTNGSAVGHVRKATAAMGDYDVSKVRL